MIHTYMKIYKYSNKLIIRKSINNNLSYESKPKNEEIVYSSQPISALGVELELLNSLVFIYRE